MNPNPQFRFIINPIAGDSQKDDLVTAIRAAFREESEYELFYTKAPQHASELAKEAVELKRKAVIAVGGDGTVNEIGKMLIGSETALGIVPSGSGNGFARHLRIPLQVSKAITCLQEFKTQRIDTGTANGMPFLVTVGTGFDSHVAHKFASHGKRGFLAYMQISMNEYLSYQPKEYQLELDGKKESCKAFVLAAANAGQYGNNIWIAPSASLTDGRLNLCILEKFPSAMVPDILMRLLNKSIEKSKYYRMVMAEQIKIEGLNDFHIDGEPYSCEGRLEIQINKSSLLVIS